MFHPKGPSFFELAVQALSSTERGYDLLAPKFDYTPFRTPDELLEPFAAAIGEPGSIECALDMCCGTGAVMRVLRPLCTGHVTGVDLSRGMLDEAARRLADAPGDAELRFVRADVRKLPFEEEFDVATISGAFGHLLLPDQGPWAAATYRALKPGGRLFFVTGEMPTPASPTWWLARGFNWAMHVRNAVIDPPFVMFYLTFTLPWARELLEANGFEVEVVEGWFERFPTAKLVIATRPG